jgi:5-methylcytosine-specific restriction endonuclease McrBC GTP-binding regulatory subunit McrB
MPSVEEIQNITIQLQDALETIIWDLDFLKGIRPALEEEIYRADGANELRQVQKTLCEMLYKEITCIMAGLNNFSNAEDLDDAKLIITAYEKYRHGTNSLNQMHPELLTMYKALN